VIVIKNNITMQDIADKFGISKVTVSKALNNKDGVSDELKQRIQDAAKELGYHFNTVARSLKANVSYNIGVIIPEHFTSPDQSNSFYLSFYQHISKILDTKNYSAILHLLTEKDELNLQLPRIYYENKVDGFLILGQIGKPYIKLLQEIQCPIIFLDFYDEHASIDAVVTDNFNGAYELTNHLFKMGHKDIGFVGNLYATSSIQDRFLGFYKSLLEHYQSLNQQWVINDRDEHGKFITMLLPEKLPTAFVCNCDQVALNLVRHLKDMGISVPDDVSIVSFDNDIYAAICDPPLTTVEVNIKEMATVAIQHILEKMEDSSHHFGRIIIKGNIIHRKSVKKIT